MPLMTPLSLWHTGPQETFNRIPKRGPAKDNEDEDDSKDEDEVQSEDDQGHTLIHVGRVV